jgi:hypothetical protein
MRTVRAIARFLGKRGFEHILAIISRAVLEFIKQIHSNYDSDLNADATPSALGQTGHRRSKGAFRNI